MGLVCDVFRREAQAMALIWSELCRAIFSYLTWVLVIELRSTCTMLVFWKFHLTGPIEKNFKKTNKKTLLFINVCLFTYSLIHLFIICFVRHGLST